MNLVAADLLPGLPALTFAEPDRAVEGTGPAGAVDARRVRLYAVADVAECPGLPGWRLELRERDGSRIGEAMVRTPVDGATALHWARLAPARLGMGSVLLEQCLAHLADRGVREVITVLPVAPGDGQDLDAALALHAAAGFTETGQFHTFTRRP
ncbi:hypothetical protein [Streptomyces sp. NPDC056069]|uniref:hypothetical protein n=1 Tax=Streptomyces sp. NPDC056069 TaxID=3345702 RepID=UPI0035DE7402